MKITLKSKNILFPTLVVFALLIVIGISTIATSSNKFFEVGQKLKEISDNNDLNAVALIGDNRITKATFNSFKALYSAGNIVLTDDELLDKLIEREIIYQQAAKENIVVNEEEVDKALQEQKDIVIRDKEAYEEVQNLIKGRNISEEEYWENLREGIKKALIRGKYKNKLKEEFKKEHPDIEQSEFEAKYKEYYNNKIDSFKKDIKIEKLIWQYVMGSNYIR